MKSGTVLIAGQTKSAGIGAVSSGASSLNLDISWEYNALSWYGRDAERQMNVSGTTYYYFALG